MSYIKGTTTAQVDLGADALGDRDKSDMDCRIPPEDFGPPQGTSRANTVAGGSSPDLIRESMTDMPTVSEFIAELQQIHIHPEGIRPIQTSVREVLKTKSALPMRKGAHGDADGRHDLRGAAEVLHAESMS